MHINSHVAEAITNEINLSQRIESAKSAAVATVVATVLNELQTQVHGINAAAVLPGLMTGAKHLIDACVDGADYISIVGDTVRRGEYMHGKSFGHSTDEEVFEKLSPESRVNLACAVASSATGHVSSLLLDSFKEAIAHNAAMAVSRPGLRR